MLKFYFKHTHFPQENQRDPNLSCFLETPVFDPEVSTDYPGGQIGINIYDFFNKTLFENFYFSDTADKLEIAKRGSSEEGKSIIICR